MATPEEQRRTFDRIIEILKTELSTIPNKNEFKNEYLKTIRTYNKIFTDAGITSEDIQRIYRRSLRYLRDQQNPAAFEEEMQRYAGNKYFGRGRATSGGGSQPPNEQTETNTNAQNEESTEKKRGETKDSGMRSGEIMRKGIGKGIRSTGEGIGKVAGKGAGLTHKAVSETYDFLKRKFGKLYYYVWWVFDSEKDYKEIASNDHAYPRNRGTFKPYYAEIGSKEIESMLAGEKSHGRVEGDFLGALGLTGRNVPFSDEVRQIELKEGQVIALGVARAKRYDWNTRDYRGITKGRLMKMDPERLLWKWTKWNSKIGEIKGVIHGRVISIDDYKKHNKDVNYLLDPGITNVGEESAKVTVKSGTRIIAAQQSSDENGFFTFTQLPLNEEIKVEATHNEFKPGKNEYPEKIVLTEGEPENAQVLVVLNNKEPRGEPRPIIQLHTGGERHNTPRTPLFGSETLDILGKSNSYRTFLIEKEPSTKPENPKSYYYFMVTKMDGEQIDNENRHQVTGYITSLLGSGITITQEKSKNTPPSDEDFNKPIERNIKNGSIKDTAEINLEIQTLNLQPGKYRVWCVLLKRQISNHEEVYQSLGDNNSTWDFNYYEFLIEDKEKAKEKNTKKKKKALPKKTKKIMKKGEAAQKSLPKGDKGGVKWHTEEQKKFLKEFYEGIKDIDPNSITFQQDAGNIFRNRKRLLGELINYFDYLDSDEKEGSLPSFDVDKVIPQNVYDCIEEIKEIILDEHYNPNSAINMFDEETKEGDIRENKVYHEANPFISKEVKK